MKRQELYKEMLYVALGPFGRLSYQKGLAVFLRSLIDSGVYLAKILKDFLLLGGKTVIGDSPVSGKIWLMAGSKNNLDSLLFLQEGLADTVFITLNKKAQSMGDYPRLNLHHAALYWFRLPVLFFQLLPIFKDMMLKKPDALFRAMGLEEAALRILQRYKPRALVFTNDHVPDMRGFLWAAGQLGIPTVFIQHASVSTLFPPLRFDLNLLEGQDSLDKYRKCGPLPGKVVLIGMPKFDHYVKYRNASEKVNRIGLCANVMDDLTIIYQTIKELLAAFPELELSFRPHPRDERSFDLPSAVQFSRSDQEGIFEFLKSQDLIIAGDTSTHLEAVLLNIFSVYYPFNDLVSDYYGYVKNGLIEQPGSLEGLIELIKRIKDDRPEVFLRATRYNTHVGTEQEGHSAEMAIRHIKALLE